MTKQAKAQNSVNSTVAGSNSALIQSEDEILAIIDSLFPREHAFLDAGRGSDCAQLASMGSLALSTDLFLENSHFKTAYFTPEEIGHKALAVNLSDLAAAGAVPSGFSLGLLCPPELDNAYLAGILSGMAALAKAYNIPLSGGDISRAPYLGFCITVWGKTIFPYGAEQPFLQRGAREGDIVFVVSPATKHPVLGMARLGLLTLEAQGRAAATLYPKACHALCSPLPMLEAGQYLALANGRLAHKLGHAPIAAMDISDGLLKDLPRLFAANPLKENTGAKLGIDIELVMQDLHPELQNYFSTSQATSKSVNQRINTAGRAASGNAVAEEEAIKCALTGGDDYLLLCAAPEDIFSTIEQDLTELTPASRVQVLGQVNNSGNICWRGKELTMFCAGNGFDHFSA